MMLSRARFAQTLATIAQSRNALTKHQFPVVFRGMGTKRAGGSDVKAAQQVGQVVDSLIAENNEIARKIVPWVLENLPGSYFRQVNDITRMDHLKALSALRGIKQNLSLTLASKLDDGTTEVTFIRPATDDSSLVSMLAGMPPADGNLSRVKVYTAADDSLALNIFTFGKQCITPATADDGADIIAYANELKAGEHSGDTKAPAYDEATMSPEALTEYFKHCQASYVSSSNPRRFIIQRTLYEQVKGTERTAVHHEQFAADGELNAGYWITAAAANVLPKMLLHKMAYVLNARGFSIGRVHLDVVDDAHNTMGDAPGSVTMLRLHVTPHDSSDAYGDLHSREWAVLHRDLARTKWTADSTMELGLRRYPTLGMDKAEIITAYAAMLHGPLNKVDPKGYSRQSILQTLTENRYIGLTTQMAELFMDRFNPANPLKDAAYTARVEEIQNAINTVEDGSSRIVLAHMLRAIEGTLRTNFYMPNRYGLSMRTDAEVMLSPDRVKPYGVFFVHGRRFNGFHLRFRDIARGGLRVVSPPTTEQLGVASAQQFDEVYNLSFAQQLKNKDIPEGGSKGVILVDVTDVNPKSKSFSLRKAVKGFVDSMLDLIVDTEETRANVVDYFGKEEILYFGPDEQITSSDINYIVAQAGKRGYSIPDAFMSSKPGAGINHKTYGVTSEGVAVNLNVALRNSGIDPKQQPFTVKITGGPDGDVAGNMMRILIRDYGSNAKIVGIADGFGCAEDPNGLDHDELMRLFQAGQPISFFERSKLSGEGKLYIADNEEGIRMRNTMHFRVQSDAFVPGGGRPNTIDGQNCLQFIRPDGTPASPLIVEGANLYLTAEARQKLFDAAKVRIVKDSSANKCGVITSSYEICASMLLNEAEFMEVKDELVGDVLAKLRELAKLEAELLFREFQHYPGALPYFSERVSNAINKAKDALGVHFADLQVEDPLFRELMPLFHEHLPKKLVEVAGDRIESRIPIQYIRNAFASSLASKIVYREGIHFIESQPVDKLAERAVVYYREERHVKALLDDLQRSSLPQEQKDLTMELIRRGGVRAALGIY